MNVASLALSKELYELSGWDDTGSHWISQAPNEYLAPQTNYPTVSAHDDSIGEYPYFDKKICPAYNLEFLIRRLSNVEVGNDTDNSEDGQYYAKRPNSTGQVDSNDKAGNLEFADTPEDAAAKLAIELIRQGILPAAPKQTKEE